MKALIRNEKEIVKETDGVVGINWANGEPLTRPEWAGGPYHLVENYVDTSEDAVAEVPPVAETQIEAIEDAAPDTIGETVEIGGKTYSLEELKKLIQ